MIDTLSRLSAEGKPSTMDSTLQPTPESELQIASFSIDRDFVGG